MLGADDDGRILFLQNKLLLYIFKCKLNREIRRLLTKISNFIQFNHKKICCNVSIAIIMKRWKYRMVDILNCSTIFHKFGSSGKYY